MTNLSNRPYAGQADLQAMIDLTQSLRSKGQMVYPIAADLNDDLADDATVQATARLWECQGKLVGFSYVSRYRYLVFAFDDSLLTLSIEAEMIELAKPAAIRISQEKKREAALIAEALESDTYRCTLLERNGFKPDETSSLLMSRSLDAPIPEPKAPDGFTIRPIAGESELEAYVALYQVAFGEDSMTVEARRNIMQSGDYIPELDLVAVAPNGELAAFLMCQIFPDDSPRAGGKREGWTDPAATHPNYRRLGLLKALLLTGMHLLKAGGIDTVLLGTESTNEIVQHTARNVGFIVASNTLYYRKKL